MVKHLASVEYDNDRLRKFIVACLESARFALHDFNELWETTERFAKGTAGPDQLAAAIYLSDPPSDLVGLAVHVSGFALEAASRENKDLLLQAIDRANHAACSATADRYVDLAQKAPQVCEAIETLDEWDREDPAFYRASVYRNDPWSYARERLGWADVSPVELRPTFEAAWRRAWETRTDTPWFATWDDVRRVARENGWFDFLPVAMAKQRILDESPGVLTTLRPIHSRPSLRDTRPYGPWGASGLSEEDLGLSECWTEDSSGTFEPLVAWEQKRHCSILRDVVGNPFHPVAFSPSWLTSTVVALAQQIYESHDFAAMPILADALEDAGCDDAIVLDHCRGPGPHVLGCFVVDRLLGKK
jgi:hypothetical protein